MSKAKVEVKKLTQHEVNKKIIEKLPKFRSDDELLGVEGKYRDEVNEIYCNKRKHFLGARKKYEILNQETIISTKKRLHENYILNIPMEFLIDEKNFEEDMEDRGLLIRGRTGRHIDEVHETNTEICNIEPWFARFIILKKFISCGRKIIIKNRLLKNLAILKTLTCEKLREFEQDFEIFNNISYPELFSKFIK